MEWSITKQVIAIFAVMIFALLMTFYVQFGEILDMDRVVQSRRDTRMYEDLKKSIPAMTIIVAAHATGGTKNGM